MTTTKSLPGIGASTTLVAVPTIDRANLKLDGGPYISPDGLTHTALYKLIAGDEDNPVSLKVNIYNHPSRNSGFGESVASVKLEGFAIETDDSTGEVLNRNPFSSSLTITLPGTNPVWSSDDFLALIGNFYTVFFTGVDGSNIPNAAITGQLKYNYAQIF